MPLQYPRYNKVYELTCQFILENNLTSFPLNLTDIVTAKGWRLEAAQRVASTLGIKYDKFIKDTLDGCEGKTWINENGCLIVYDNRNRPFSRVRWTIAHEIGHIALGHLCNDRGDWMEKEADYFAANLLAPFGVMKKCGIEHAYQIEKFFGLSKEAAKNRSAAYLRWKNRQYISHADVKVIKMADKCKVPQVLTDFGKMVNTTRI